MGSIVDISPVLTIYNEQLTTTRNMAFPLAFVSVVGGVGCELLEQGGGYRAGFRPSSSGGSPSLSKTTMCG